MVYIKKQFTQLIFASFIGLGSSLGLIACDKASETQISSATESVTIINPLIRAMPPGQQVTAMYMQLNNASAKDHYLVKVEGDISNMIELHTHTNDNGVMRMGQVESIPILANSSVEAKPGSYHVMIMALQNDMNIGDKYDFNFIFKDGSSSAVTVEVKQVQLN